MAAYATAADYLAVYDTDMTSERLSAWLGRAAEWLDVQMCDKLDPSDAKQLSALKYVNIELVNRLDASPMAGVGVTSYSQSANGFQETLNYANSAGGFNLLPSERKMLGLGSSIGFGSWLGGGGDA